MNFALPAMFIHMSSLPGNCRLISITKEAFRFIVSIATCHQKAKVIWSRKSKLA